MSCDWLRACAVFVAFRRRDDQGGAKLTRQGRLDPGSSTVLVSVRMSDLLSKRLQNTTICDEPDMQLFVQSSNLTSATQGSRLSMRIAIAAKSHAGQCMSLHVLN